MAGDYRYTCADDPARLFHRRFIGEGASGQVHEVQNSVDDRLL